MRNTILFDLDGTLAPFNQDDFIHSYFGALVKLLAPMGYGKDALIAALWKGTMAMIQNDGSRLNCERFWDVFTAELGQEILQVEPVLEDFYTGEFDKVKAVLTAHPDRKPLLDLLRAKGFGVVLATNPIFPTVAVETRLRWVGLTSGDFDHVTTYENSRRCKPNPDYYRDILAQIGKNPEDCLMIGNNPVDDGAAREAGLDFYLVTDCIENPNGLPIDGCKHSTFAQLEEYLRGL